MGVTKDGVNVGTMTSSGYWILVQCQFAQNQVLDPSYVETLQHHLLCA